MVFAYQWMKRKWAIATFPRFIDTTLQFIHPMRLCFYLLQEIFYYYKKITDLKSLIQNLSMSSILVLENPSVVFNFPSCILDLENIYVNPLTIQCLFSFDESFWFGFVWVWFIMVCVWIIFPAFDCWCVTNFSLYIIFPLFWYEEKMLMFKSNMI